MGLTPKLIGKVGGFFLIWIPVQRFHSVILLPLDRIQEAAVRVVIAVGKLEG